MSMSGARMFWLDILHDYNFDQSLSLPYDRYRLSNEHRTGHGTSISFDFDQHLSHRFLRYASLNNITPQHLALACYYVFLFKLTNGNRDLCIGIKILDRYTHKLKSIIGMFENIIPLRCQLDPYWSFNQLIEHSRERIIDSLKYSYYPLQQILDKHLNNSKPTFLNTLFEFQSNENSQINIGTSKLSSITTSSENNENDLTNNIDLSVIIQHDLHLNQLSCTINGSIDIFNIETINNISQRFHLLLQQLFSISNNQMEKSICQLSLILPNENLVMQRINNTEIMFPSLSCVHHEFVKQVLNHPQKLAVELDDQSLTYSELLYYVQILSLYLLQTYQINVGEIICQCVERSLSMVSFFYKKRI